MAFNAPCNSTKLHNLLEVVEEIRGLQEPSDDIQFPDIVVCGEQSAGKSSVLRALAGVKLPCAKAITTRMALRLRLVCDPALVDGQSYALIGKHPTVEETGERVEEENLDSLAEKIEHITLEMAGSGKGVNSEDMIYLKVVRNHGPTLTLVDLPGISHANDEIKRLTDECFRKRFLDPDNKHLILLVLSAAVDVESYASRTVARAVDENGERTICVLTNVDRYFGDNLGETVRQLGETAKVYPVYNPDDDTLTPAEARQKEAELFAALAPKNGLAEGQWGIKNLGLYLMKAQEPVVESTLRKLSERISTDLSKKKNRLSELLLAQKKTGNHRPNEIILQIIMRVQEEFKERATASSSRVDSELNVARRTERLYRQFQENVRGFTPPWLSDEFKPKVEESILEHSGGDIRGQVVSAEFTVFRTAFESKLAAECTALVNNLRLCVKDVLERLIRSPGAVQRPGLPSYLCTIVDKYLQKRHQKAEEIVNYLAKAELTKRFTQDESYQRIKTKIERLAAQMRGRRDAMPFQEKNTDVPEEQIIDCGEDDDVAGVPLAFIKNYYDRVQEQFKTDRDVDVAKCQVSLYAYSKIMTRRVVDVVPMQAHLLLVNDVFDMSTRPASAVGSHLGGEVISVLAEESPEHLKRVTAVDPEMEENIKGLSADVERLGDIVEKITGAIS